MPKKYTEQDLKDALAEIAEKKITVFKASKQYNIPHQTLYDKIKNKYTTTSAGPPTILTAEEEELICDWIRSMSDIGFPVTKDLLISSVKKLVTELKRPNKFKDGVPGRHWYESFMRRHPSITKRVCQTLTISRVAVTEEKIRGWFSRIQTYFENNNLMEALQDPTRIFNCDESAFFLTPKGETCLSRKGVKTVYSRSGNDEKENLTVLLGSDAVGNLMPVMVVYGYKRIPGDVLEQYPKDWVLGRTDTGWMTSEAFFEYIANAFHPYLIKKNIKKPVVLFLDGHVSHLGLHVSEFCKKNDIITVPLLPNSTHLLQPMDVAVFKPLKTYWRKNVYSWRMENNAARMKKENFAPVLKKSIDSLKPETIINGFRKSGLFPFNENAINYEALLTNSASATPSSSRSLQSTPQIAENVEQNITTSKMDKNFIKEFEQLLGPDKLSTFQQSGEEWTGDIRDTNLFIFWKKATEKSAPNEAPSPILPELSVNFGDSTLQANECTLSNISLDWPDHVTQLDMYIDADGNLISTVNPVNLSPTPSENTVDQVLIDQVLEDSSPKPEIPTPFKNAFFYPETPIGTNKKRVRKKLTPIVAAADEYINHQRRLLEEKKDQMEKKEERKKLRKLKKAQLNSTKLNKKPAKKKGENLAKDDTSITVGQFVVVLYEEEKYPGQVVKICGENKFKVKTMHMSTMVNGCCTWRWPEKDDVLEYSTDEILKTIGPPVPLNKRGVFSVKI